MAIPKDEHLHIKVSPEMKEALNQIAAERDVSAAQVVREAVQEVVNRFANRESERLEEATVS